MSTRARARMFNTTVVAAAPPPAPPSGSTAFDSYYTGWAGYTSMAAAGTTTRSYSLPSKPARGSGIATAQLIDPISSMRMYRLTDFVADSYGVRARHLYSRRTPTNADDTKVLMLTGSGFYHVLDLATFTKDVQPGSNGSLPSFAQDTEPFWHPTDPNVIWRGDQNGTLNYYSYNLTTDVTTSLFTLSGKLPAGFESATRAWTRDEGRPSRDGRYWCLQMETPAFAMVGIVCYDRVLDQVIGHILTTNRPNHCSMSPLGNYMVVSFEDATGTRAYPRTYTGATTGGTLLLGGSEHSDIAVGPDGTTEWFVCADYSARGGTSTYYIYARKLSDGTRIDLIPMYPVPGEDYGVHISGNASVNKPGWVLLSTYSSGENYGSARPASNARLNYETIFWCPIQASPTLKIVSEHHARPYDPTSTDDDEYFNEPQASPNADGTKIFFCSNWIGRSGTTTNTQPDLYMIGAPSDWDTRSVTTAPSIGGYASTYDLHTVGVNPKTTPPFTTQASGSSLYVFAATDLDWFSTSGISHNKTGAVSHITALAYTDWAPYGARAFRVPSLTGGTGQTVTMTTDASIATAEKTLMAVEVRNGQTLQASQVQELPASDAATVTGPSVTTTGPAVLLSAWYGDANVSTPMSASLTSASTAAGWQQLVEITVDGQAHIQAGLAARVVTVAGTYSCEWAHVPNQRAIMFALAVQA